MQRLELMEALEKKGVTHFGTPTDAQAMSSGMPEGGLKQYAADKARLKKMGLTPEDFYVSHGGKTESFTAYPLEHLREMQRQAIETGKAVGPFNKEGKMKFLSIPFAAALGIGALEETEQ